MGQIGEEGWKEGGVANTVIIIRSLIILCVVSHHIARAGWGKGQREEMEGKGEISTFPFSYFQLKIGSRSRLTEIT